MAHLFGREWTRKDLAARVGDLSQISGIRLSAWQDGREQGLRVAHVLCVRLSVEQA
jgi:hypothetical protein